MPPLAYFASFCLTICMHIIPLEFAGKVLDLYLMAGEATIYYVLKGVLMSQRSKIMSLPSEEAIMNYLKNDLMKDIFTTGNIASILLMEDLQSFYEQDNRA